MCKCKGGFLLACKKKMSKKASRVGCFAIKAVYL